MYYSQLPLTIISKENMWSIQIAIIMIICNLIAIIIGRYAIKKRSDGPPIKVFGAEGLGIPELLATTSLGHIIGVGTIIGLRSIEIIS